jgi:hypothetical protein
MAGFVNETAGATLEDLRGLNAHLLDEFPDLAEGLSPVMRMEAHNPYATNAYLTTTLVDRRLKQARTTIKKFVAPDQPRNEDLWKKVDLQIAVTSRQQWETAAARRGLSADEFIEETRQRLFKAFKS